MLLALLVLAACTPDPAKSKPAKANPTTDTGTAVEIVHCPGEETLHTAFTITPWVQYVQPTSAWILWETQTGLESRVDYGPTDTLGSAACGQNVPILPGDDPDDDVTIVHEVELTGLAQNTTYRYRVKTGDGVGEILQFKTAPEASEELSFRLVAMGDSQRDDALPDMYREVVQEGVMATAGDIDMVLFAGDLVDNGWIIDEWKDDFFAAGPELMSEVPFYPVLGNHEGASPHYFRYFHLPENGDAEHYYHFDYSNVRVIGLDSNGSFADVEQLSWLDDVLADTCGAAHIDFVFAQLHHPYRSEPWIPGNTEWSGEVVNRLETFSTDCDKPSIHFYGHTHAYSRGQTQEHRHVMVNVSSAGGALDRWGAQAQEDYEEFSVSQDEYGFVIVDVEAGDDPLFSLQRISRGTPEAPLDNVVSDALTIPRYNIPPNEPRPIDAGDICVESPTVTATRFDDADGHSHQGSQWQVTETCGDFSQPLVDRWKQDTNWFMGVDTQAGDDLEDEDLPELVVGESYCWRVRYRDSGLAWSAWSAEQSISAVNCP